MNLIKLKKTPRKLQNAVNTVIIVRSLDTLKKIKKLKRFKKTIVDELRAPQFYITVVVLLVTVKSKCKHFLDEDRRNIKR